MENVIFSDVRAKEKADWLLYNFDLFGIQTIKIPVNELPDNIDMLPNDKSISYFCSSDTRSTWTYNYLLLKSFNTKWFATSNVDIASIQFQLFLN